MFSRKQCAAWLLLTALLCALFSAPSASAAKDGSEYRALLIGEQRFLWFDDEDDPDSRHWTSTAARNLGDVRNLAKALGNVVGPVSPCGPLGEAFKVTQRTDLSATGIRNAIRDVFKDTEDQDISIFFIATHGYEDRDGNLLAAFTGNSTDRSDVKAYWQNRFISFDTLAGWLKTYVKGRVFVILESCGSGSSIYDPDVPENKAARRADSKDAPNEDAERFVQRAVDAFAKADPGIPVLTGENNAKSTGDLRLPKFYVLTASAHQEKSYGWETHETDSSYNFFTKWLIQGIGSKDNSPADADGDGYLSLAEMFDYVKQYHTISDGSATYTQHVQRYPIGNTDHLLKLSDPAAYTVASVQGSPHTIGSGTDVKISVSRSGGNNGLADRLDSVLVDGKKLSPDCYSVSIGPDSRLIITLKSRYLDTLCKGTHTVTIRFTDGDAETRITIREVPKTGDAGRPGLWLTLILLGLAGVWFVISRRTKSRKGNRTWTRSRC